LTKFPDIFVVSTPFSLESPVIQSAQNHNDKNNIRVIFTCAGSEHIPVRNAGKSDSQFIIGYVGTVDYCKLHPSFVRMSANANIPEAKFVVVGGDKHTQIARETIDSGYGDKFEFTGPVSNVAEYLAKFEIFGYPLSPDHYGTGEQALIEAMTAGIPVVVFNNGAEKHLVDNNVTGLIVDSEDQYTDALEKLYHDSDLRNKLSNNCRHYARDRFSIGTMIDAWQSLFDEVISYPKKAHLWLSPHTLTGADLFLESLGDSKNAFAVSKYNQYKKEKLEAEKVIAELKGAFASSTRGSPFHYRAHYPHDPYLNLWCGLIEMNMGLYQKALNSFMFAQKIESSRIAWYAADVLEHLKYSQSNSFYIRKPTAFRNEQAKLYNSASYESEEVCAYS
jgi:hypothetical protein